MKFSSVFPITRICAKTTHKMHTMTQSFLLSGSEWHTCFLSMPAVTKEELLLCFTSTIANWADREKNGKWKTKNRFFCLPETPLLICAHTYSCFFPLSMSLEKCRYCTGFCEQKPPSTAITWTRTKSSSNLDNQMCPWLTEMPMHNFFLSVYYWMTASLQWCKVLCLEMLIAFAQITGTV